MRINSLGGSGFIQTQISSSTKKLTKIFEQLSTGKKVNRAGDDPAASALINSLKSTSSGLEQANRNIASAQGALNIAGGAVNSSIEQLQSMRDLAVQAANGTLNASDRANLQSQFQQGTENLDDIAANTNFNGNSLLDGSYSSNVQVGAEAGQQSSVSIGNLSASALGVSGLNINTQEGAEDAIEAIDAAIAQATSEASSIGASQNALEYRENANAIAQENIEAARSQAEDADIAETTSNLNREQVIQQAQILVLKEQIKQKSASLSLFENLKKV